MSNNYDEPVVVGRGAGLDPNSNVYKLFHTNYLVMTKVINYLSIQEEAKIVEEEEPAPAYFEHIASGIEVICNDDDQAHIDLLMGTPHLGESDEEAMEILQDIESYELTINQMIEIADMEATFTMKEWEKLPEVFSIVNGYLFELENLKSIDPHRKPPPEEDVIKIRNFRNKIRGAAEAVTAGNVDYAEFDKMFFNFTPASEGNRAAASHRVKVSTKEVVLGKGDMVKAEEYDPYAFMKED